MAARWRSWHVDGITGGTALPGRLLRDSYNARPRIGNNLCKPLAITSIASAARINPISRVITLMPVFPSTWPGTRYLRT